jgi:hypothetical protein
MKDNPQSVLPQSCGTTTPNHQGYLARTLRLTMLSLT